MADSYYVWDGAKEKADVYEVTGGRSTPVEVLLKQRGLSAAACMHAIADTSRYYHEIVSPGKFEQAINEKKREYALRDPSSSIVTEVPVTWHVAEEVGT